MELAKRWLDSQKATPSFVSGRGEEQSFGGIDMSILDRPLPRALSPGRKTPVRRNSPSSRLAYTPRAAVHEELMAKGRLYEQRREALREKRIRDELKENKRVPRVSLQARMLKREEPIENRFRKLQKEKEEQKKFELMKLDDKLEDAHASFQYKPKISNRGRRATSRLLLQSDQHEAWLRRREEKLEAERLKWVTAEMAEVHDTPDINPHSERLAAKRREREGLAGMSHIDAMIERDRLRKLAVYERQSEMLNEINPNPKITQFAASIPRSGTAGDRLYAHSFEIEERRAERMRQKLEEEGSSAFHAPKITDTAASKPRNMTVEDELMHRHLEALQEREAAIRHHMERENERHTPAINPVSDAIAARLQQTPKERLLEPRAIYVDTSAQPSFAPQLSSRARSTSRSSSTTSFHEREAHRLETLEKAAQRRQEKLMQLKQEKAQRELEECTFQPETHSWMATDPQGDLYDRTSQWQRRREKKLEEQRSSRHETDLNGCTFHPTVHDANRTPPPSRNVVYGGDGKAWGVQEFVERQKEARRRREEEEARLYDTGHKWRNEPTQPREFLLGQHDAQRIRSLDPPVNPRPSATVAREASSPFPGASWANSPRRSTAGNPIVPFGVQERFGRQ